MSDDHRLVRKKVELIDAHIDPPRIGCVVIGLTSGGVLNLGVTWSADSLKVYEAWMPYPKRPESVKQRMGDKYK